MTPCRRALLGSAVVGLLVCCLAGPAGAVAPERSGWWNAASVGGATVPRPITASGDLHVENGPTGPQAYAAVYYGLAGAIDAARLVLQVAPGSVVGTVALVVCPTHDSRWSGGDDQAWSTAPAYTCTGQQAQGLVSSDGTAVTFALSALQQAAPGAYSLAILPAPGSAPFSVDLAKPDAASLTLLDAAPAAAPPPTDSAVSAPAAVTPPSGTAINGPTSFAAPVTSAVPAGAGAAPPVTAPDRMPQVTAGAVATHRAGLSPVRRAGVLTLLVLLVLAMGPVLRDSDAPVTRGVGRFTRAREAAPRPLL